MRVREERERKREKGRERLLLLLLSTATLSLSFCHPSVTATPLKDNTLNLATKKMTKSGHNL